MVPDIELNKDILFLFLSTFSPFSLLIIDRYKNYTYLNRLSLLFKLFFNTFSTELFAFLEESNESQEGYAAKELGVNSYGVSMTTLEEVFLQLEETNQEETGKQDHQEEVTQQRDCLTADNVQHSNTEEPLSVEDGNRKFTGSSSNLRSVVDLNSTEIRNEARKPPSIVKQQFLGLLKVCTATSRFKLA